MAKKFLALLLTVAMVCSFALVAHADDGFVDGKFTETRHITVEIYDRGNDGGTDPTDNMYTDYIKKGMLETYNVEVEFVKVPRWTEGQEINNLLAAQTAPDICVTYDYATILSYAERDGVQDLSALIEETKDLCPNLWNWLGETNIYWDKDPVDGTVWAIEGKRAETERIATFVRQDWLDALGLAAPTTTEEFEAMLYAFKERAAELPVDDASKVIPFSTSYDIGWRCSPIIESFLPSDITDYDFYVHGGDDRMVTQQSTKEAIRLINKWYNDGLMWNNFALYGSGDTTEDDNIKAGYVGAFCHNWDLPFRDAENGYNASLKRNVGENAKYVAVDCFTNDAGKHTKYMYSQAGDRKIFFPTTNDEPLASMLYLDWISDPEHIQYLQIGDEGVTHTVHENGAIEILSAAAPAVQNSSKNIDITITCNGMKLIDPAITVLSRTLSYPGNDAADVSNAIACSTNDGVSPKNVNVGAIEAEAEYATGLASLRDQVYDKAVVASVADFDAVWDDNFSEYLDQGGQDIMDERAEKWETYFGDATMLP